MNELFHECREEYILEHLLLDCISRLKKKIAYDHFDQEASNKIQNLFVMRKKCK